MEQKRVICCNAFITSCCDVTTSARYTRTLCVSAFNLLNEQSSDAFVMCKQLIVNCPNTTALTQSFTRMLAHSKCNWQMLWKKMTKSQWVLYSV